ncbi:hypothetical protein M3Y14_30585 [Bacillus thuringiensis]|uniref:hypothetical protein n=1 Tax=Bacillus thuringiensis TaxID=1428 RepID=UPI0022255B9D|nr:hypothetical protein [Bacillus thuringiensis]UYX52609.1 hypothetical protein M3Y14_30585 [Bacillus thuringiensis]
MKYYKELSKIILEFAEKWTFKNGLKLKNVGLVNPSDGENSLDFKPDYLYTGHMMKEDRSSKIFITDSFTNQHSDIKKEKMRKRLLLEQIYFWDKDYEFIIQPTIYTVPLLPPHFSVPLNPAIEADLFKHANSFESQLEEHELINADVFIECNQTVNVSVSAKKQKITQKFHVVLEISGDIIIQVENPINSSPNTITFYSVPFTEVYKSELLNNCAFQIKGDSVIFTEVGCFTGYIYSEIEVEGERFDLTCGKSLGKYKIPYTLEGDGLISDELFNFPGQIYSESDCDCDLESRRSVRKHQGSYTDESDCCD